MSVSLQITGFYSDSVMVAKQCTAPSLHHRFLDFFVFVQQQHRSVADITRTNYAGLLV